MLPFLCLIVASQALARKSVRFVTGPTNGGELFCAITFSLYDSELFRTLIVTDFLQRFLVKNRFEEYEPAQVRQMIQHGKRPDEEKGPFWIL